MFRNFFYKEARSLMGTFEHLQAKNEIRNIFSPNWKISTCVTYISPNEMKLVTKLPKGGCEECMVNNTGKLQPDFNTQYWGKFYAAL